MQTVQRFEHFEFDVPAQKQETISAFKSLLNTFKNDIKIKTNSTSQQKDILAFAGIGKPKVATIYPNVKHNITEKLAGKYKDFAKDKSFNEVKQEALMQAFGEKYDKLN